MQEVAVKVTSLADIQPFFSYKTEASAKYAGSWLIGWRLEKLECASEIRILDC